MEINLILSLLLFVSMLRLVIGTNRGSFKRNMNVTIAKYTDKKTNSKPGTKDIGECARFCKAQSCLSFAYIEAEKTCDTFSGLFMEEDGVALTFTSYFSKLPTDCSDIEPGWPSGVYQIAHTSGQSFKVYCDMETADGTWTVIQNRYDGSVRFDGAWAEYKNGFGDLNGEFWLGNAIIHTLTQTARVLRIELEGFNLKAGYAEYSEFKIADESDDYRLTANGCTRNISHNAMAHHNGRGFSTSNRGTSKSCSKNSRGGWWYGNCQQANLNGLYTPYRTGHEYLISWWYFPGPEKRIALKKTRMMIRHTRG